MRSTFCSILLKNNFNPKAVSQLMGHVKEIITIDVYGDIARIIQGCLDDLQPFIDEVMLRTKHKNGENYYWLLYFSFLSPQQLRNVEEIIEKLRPHIRDISFRTYYRRRRLTHSVLSCGGIHPKTVSTFWRSSFRTIRKSGKKNK